MSQKGKKSGTKKRKSRAKHRPTPMQEVLISFVNAIDATPPGNNADKEAEAVSKDFSRAIHEAIKAPPGSRTSLKLDVVKDSNGIYDIPHNDIVSGLIGAGDRLLECECGKIFWAWQSNIVACENQRCKDKVRKRKQREAARLQAERQKKRKKP